jgi:hypothetical protein
VRFLFFAAILAGAVCAQTAVPRSPAEVQQLGDRSGKLQPGDPAPDFNLKVMHSQMRISLSGFRDRRPVALVFGSYT